jgi:putative ABC transport system ATP-binding protein
MALESTKLHFNYKPSAPFVFEPLQVNKGQSALLLGPSGSGKTTFLHLLAGLLKPHKGQIKIGNRNINALNEREKDLFRGQNVGIIFQKSYFLPYLTIAENLKLAAATQKINLAAADVATALKDLSINHIANQKPANCSLGEQQRASIARALIAEPKVILADEPTSALDDENAFKVANLLQQLAREKNAALLIVTHDSRLKQIIPKHYQL